MAKRRKPTRRPPTARDYPRMARVDALVHEIIAEELEKIDDERLELVTVTSVSVDGDLARAVVRFDHSRDVGEDDAIVEVLEELRPRLQSAVGRQATMKATPILTFQPDEVLRGAERIDAVLRDLKSNESGEPPLG